MFEGLANIFSKTSPGARTALLIIGAWIAPAATAQAPAPVGAAWVELSGPTRAAPGAMVVVRARVRNLGRTIWPSTGPNRTVLEGLLVDSTGNPWMARPAAGWFAYSVMPGAAGTAEMHLRAPDRPGRYTALLGVAHVLRNGRTLDTLPPVRWDFEVEELRGPR